MYQLEEYNHFLERIWYSNFEPKSTPLWLFVLRDLRHKGCYLCKLLITHICHEGFLHSRFYQLVLFGTFAVGTKGHGVGKVKVVALHMIRSVGLWFLAISVAGKVSLTTVCQLGGGGAGGVPTVLVSRQPDLVLLIHSLA